MKRKLLASFIVCALSLLLCLINTRYAGGQVRAVYDRGAAGLMQTLKRLNTSKSVLMIGAHPDDEDTALLAYLARGESARTAYLSLTRGDGGQNIIGSELGEALGVIRTEELIQARRLDGAEQFFTRAYDYGFSKTLAEAKSKWDERVVLCDVVAVIRSFRPQVVISQFSGTTADGHGQHQYSGYISPLAVEAAADVKQCADSGDVWKVLKVYVRHGFRATTEARLRVNTGRYDPIVGRSYFEIAMEARSQHKSQEQGVLELRGDQFSGLNLRGSEAKENGIFDGLDLRTDPGDEFHTAIAGAIRDFDTAALEKTLPHLARAYALTGAEQTGSDASRQIARQRKSRIAEAVAFAAGIQIDALADSETVVPGETVFVGIKAFLPNRESVKVKEINLTAPQKWTITAAEKPKTNNPAFISREAAVAERYFSVTPPRDWRADQPYWLTEPRDGDLFRAPSDAGEQRLPFQPRAMTVRATIELFGTDIEIERIVEFRFADDVRGEIRRDVVVVPAITLNLEHPLLIIPYSDKPQKHRVAMTVTNHSKQRVAGVVSLNFAAAVEWPYTATSKTFTLTRPDEKATISFELTIPGRTPSGGYSIFANAMVGEVLATDTMQTIAHPHIQTHRIYRRAVIDAKVVDLKTAPFKIGYIVGSGDRVPDAIRQMGFNLEMISEADLGSGNLSRFDTIVVGIRAYQVRTDIAANNQRLLDFVSNGGNLVVQYQLPPYAQQKLTPFPTQLGPRVADERAEIRIVQPQHSLLNFPNKITNADFEGWVQERNLYNFTTLEPPYIGLLESHDQGEAENFGGLVYAKLGKGSYVYCSYSLFRQLPGGVSGAYRLAANLISQPRER